MRLSEFFRTGAFCLLKNFLKKFAVPVGKISVRPWRAAEKGEITRPPGTKGGENMNPNRFEWQTRCEFNAYCKHSLRNELIDALRERKSRKRREVNFSDLAPHEEKQLYTIDRYFVNEEEEAFYAGGLRITAKLLADTMHSLPEEKR